jgi:glyoxylase I family protein
MALELSKQAIDLGIVIRNGEKTVAFYRDVLGFRFEGSIPMPIGKGTMHRLWCGDSLIKLVEFDPVPPAPPTGGIPAGSGFRYMTIHTTNIAGIVAECEAAGVPIAMPVREIRPGVTAAMVTDPDGNIVEFVNYTT